MIARNLIRPSVTFSASPTIRLPSLSSTSRFFPTRTMATSSSSTPAPLKLSNGLTMPHYGIGVWEMRGKETVTSLQTAVEKWGYRLIE